jgi:hypothetical protein
MDLTTFATSWAPLLLSLAVVAERVWSRANGQLERKVEALHRRLDELRSFRDRVEGAGCMDRLTTVEHRQREDETALVRVDQRLQSVDDRLAQLLAMLQSNQP